MVTVEQVLHDMGDMIKGFQEHLLVGNLPGARDVHELALSYDTLVEICRTEAVKTMGSPEPVKPAVLRGHAAESIKADSVTG